MASDDVAVLADQYRIGEPERPDAARNLGDLGIAVRAGIAGEWDQFVPNSQNSTRNRSSD